MMKRNILCACLLAIGMFSCDYLDVAPKGKFVIENVEEYLEMLEDGSPNIGIDNFGLVSNEKTCYNVNGIRLAEVYLMIAEAYARSGSASDITNAMKYLNDLRSKRIKPEYNVALSADSKENALKLIRKERAVELVFTCNSFFDLRRFAAEEKQTLHKAFGGNEYTLSPDSHLLIFPFPQEAFVGNPYLQQNSK